MSNASGQFEWRATNAPNFRRHDDIAVVDSQTVWAINSDGDVIRTLNGGVSWERKFHVADDADPTVWLRAIAFATSNRGWVGTTSPQKPLFETSNTGNTWQLVPNLPVGAPSFVCGISVASESVIWASGTNDPDPLFKTGVMKSVDGGASWVGFDMSPHAHLLVDCYFPEPDRGWVVGGRADVANPTRNQVKPVVLYTEDGGMTWTNLLAGQEGQFPRGEWGWKIFFVNSDVGYISLENLRAGAVLKTTDGGKTWTRKALNDTQPNGKTNANLEGIGFIDEDHGWVGGWGDAVFNGGYSSQTNDGGDNWQAANQIGLFLNRIRFLGNPIEVGYASGDTIYKYSREPLPAGVVASPEHPRLLDAHEPIDCERSVEINVTVPSGAERLTIDVWNRFAIHVASIASEDKPAAGAHRWQWNFTAADGSPLPPGQYVYRVSVDRQSESRIVALASGTRDPSMNRPTSFKLHIRQMFNEIDVDHMSNAGPFSIDLTSYDQVKAQAARILLRLKNEDDPMPPADDGGPWPQEWIALFERWITEGFPA